MELTRHRGALASIEPHRIDTTPTRRHEHRVQSVSSDYERLRRLDHLVVGEDDAATIVTFVCRWTRVPVPVLKFHARRSPFTAATERPRDRVIAESHELGFAISPAVSTLAPEGAIRLGRSVTLMTLSHELGHHLVHHVDPYDTPAHGNVWVRRFDQAAAVVTELLPT
jgi:hypothetical protein